MNENNYSLGQLVFDIGCLIKQYEQTLTNNNTNGKLLKTKQVLELYPHLTQYGLDQAVRENKIPVIKRGKLNFYDSRDIDEFIKNQKINSTTSYKNCVSEKIKYI